MEPEPERILDICGAEEEDAGGDFAGLKRRMVRSEEPVRI